MPREQTPLRTIQVDYRCDKCDTGHMRPTGVMLMSDPPKFPHCCTECDALMTFTEKYPAVTYVFEGERLDLSEARYRQQTL